MSMIMHKFLRIRSLFSLPSNPSIPSDHPIQLHLKSCRKHNAIAAPARTGDAVAVLVFFYGLGCENVSLPGLGEYRAWVWTRLRSAMCLQLVGPMENNAWRSASVVGPQSGRTNLNANIVVYCSSTAITYNTCVC